MSRQHLLVTPCLLLLAVVVGCQQDPYQIHNYGDAGPSSDSWDDMWIPPDATPVDRGADTGDATGKDISYDACVKQVEVCNNVDDNCNNQIDEGFNKLTGVQYCENCKGCNHLLKLNAIPKCVAGKCEIDKCFNTHWDINKDPKDGCEYACIKTGTEICDGLDNDCNKKVDDGVTLTSNICKTQGPCAGSKAVCKGQQGWICSYPATVELQPCTKSSDCGAGYTCNAQSKCDGIVIVDEKICDGKDGDCDGLADDPWANAALSTALGKTCDPEKACTTSATCGGSGSTCVNKKCTPKKGVCRDVGKYVCDTANTSKTICKLTTAGKASSSEKCNGLDDDCDGTVDDAVTDTKWITIGSGSSKFSIFKYEASRPDSTLLKAGIMNTGRPCSVPNRLPWSNVTKVSAQAVCKKACSTCRLCTTTEWQTACRGSSILKFPYGNTFLPKKCNGRAYDTTKDAVLQTNLPQTCVSTWSVGTILNMSGNVKEWTASGFTSSGTPTGYKIKGGAYDTPSINGYGEGMSCTYDLPAPTSTLQIPTLGFRCCKK